MPTDGLVISCYQCIISILSACLQVSITNFYLQAGAASQSHGQPPIDPQTFQAQTAGELTYGKEKAQEMLALKRGSGTAADQVGLAQPQDVTGDPAAVGGRCSIYGCCYSTQPSWTGVHAIEICSVLFSWLSLTLIMVTRTETQFYLI